MRQLQLLVPDEQRETADEVLEEEAFDYYGHTVDWDGESAWLVSIPIPTDAVGYVLDRFEEAGIDTSRYLVVGAAESATTPRMDAINDRFADQFQPLTTRELRSKARDMSEDLRSYLAMIFLSALIATAGLLLESPAVVVGSMVIAPIVGPVLTTAVGVTTGDGPMTRDSIWYQLAGIAVAIIGAWSCSLALQLTGFMPIAMDVSSIDLIAIRIAPGILTVVIGLASGAAAAYGLATKGPTSLIGVMIAAALIPSAATVGIAAAWNQPRIAIGSFLLVVLTLILINVGATVILWRFGYGHPSRGISLPSGHPVKIVGVVILVILVVGVVGLSVDQTMEERTIDAEIEAVLDDPAHDAYDLVTVGVQYHGPGAEDRPLVTVTVSESGDGDVDALAADLDYRLGEETVVRVRVIEYTYGPHQQTV